MAVARRCVPALAAGLIGCAPLGEYAGARPGERGTAPAPITAGRDDSAMRLGTLAPGAAPRTVVLYGDNRPGFRMESQRWEYHALTHWGVSPPYGALRGLMAVPMTLVEAFVPFFNGPRDLVAWFTRRSTGGGEKRLLEALAREPRLDLVISTGDVVTDGRRGRLWGDFARRAAALRGRAPWVAAPGNHERLYDARSRASWEAAIQPALQPGRYWCYLEDPATRALWVFLDSDLLTDVHDNRDPATRRAESLAQLQWADSVLARPARFRFVVLHHPLISAGHYLRDWSREGEGESASNRRRLLEMCVERGVNAVIAGHEHLYQRLWVGSTRGGFWQITTGGGGAPLYIVEAKEREGLFNTPLPAGLEVSRESVRLRSTYHYCRLTLPAADAGGAAASVPLVAYRVSITGGATPFDTLDLARPFLGVAAGGRDSVQGNR